MLRYWKVTVMPCLFLDPGKATAILRKAIYHPPILSSQPRLVLSRSPPEPKMSSFQWAFFFWPTVLASLSDVSQIEIRPKGQSCYPPPAALPMAASENTEKEKHTLFKDGKQKRNGMECVKFNVRTGFYKFFSVRMSISFIGLEKAFLLNSILCLCMHMRSLLNYWLGKKGKVGTFCTFANEECFQHKLLLIPTWLLSRLLSLSVSILHWIEKWPLAETAA